jgi:hypothetical protein
MTKPTIIVHARKPRPAKAGTGDPDSDLHRACAGKADMVEGYISARIGTAKAGEEGKPGIARLSIAMFR